MISRIALPVIIACLFPSCSSANGPDDEQLKVAGTYATQVSLTENSCPNITVQSLPTVVNHAAGANALSLQHGPLTYSGTVSASGAFTTVPNVIQDPGAGTQTTLVIAGQFTATGFTAEVTVTMIRNVPPNCGYKVQWVGTKQGSPNTIP
jgi:hypothetical protein